MSLVAEALEKISEGTRSRTDDGYGPPAGAEFKISPNAVEKSKKKTNADTSGENTVKEALQEAITGRQGLVRKKMKKIRESNQSGVRLFERSRYQNTPGDPGHA